jgi:surfeit locus 1 family protein
MSVPGVLALLALGTGQVQRLQWKEALIAERAARVAAEAVAVPPPGAALDEAQMAALDYRRAAATGVFLHERELYLAARSLKGEPGYHVVTPMRQATGGVLLVDRGWVPVDRKDPMSRLEGQIGGSVTVEGLLRRPGRRNWLVPDNEPAKNAWYWTDLPAMAAAAAGDEAVAPLILDAGPAENPGGLPQGGQTRVQLPNDHLQYAITWYALAMALAVIYVLYSWRREG